MREPTSIDKRLERHRNRQRLHGCRPRPPVMDRRKVFWKYSIRAAFGARERAQKAGVPFSIDAYFIDALLLDQEWKCAISGIPFDPPGQRKPFSPSLDRIVPSLGYVPGNIRVVCMMINMAMADWGLTTLMIVARALVKKG